VAVARIHDTGTSLAQAAALSSAFPVGMALGRLIGPLLVAPTDPVLTGCLMGIAGTGCFIAFQDRWALTVGLGLAGLGIAVLYPLTLARLAATPTLSARHSASLGALASGTAILLAPTALAASTSVLSLRVAFLLPAVLLATLLTLARTSGAGR
jgi:hypothetical protein